MTHDIFLRLMLVSAMAVPVIVYAAGQQPKAQTIAANHVDVIESSKPAEVSSSTAPTYGVYDPAAVPHTWCYCALTTEEEIFLKQYEP